MVQYRPLKISKGKLDEQRNSHPTALTWLEALSGN
jgi:hypothetical protein